ncbi:glycosyltransferase family 4 protein [Propionivibrio dicarboxylicus]|uniref:Glycosyltransferase involved in cell wall bisynthesis n=1 Tax=Propionivibrio dicarboxylicus TaxID=83767 RepID=A0A1G8E0H1_9RHOO|nr:glycosyltransferase family 4 protein [Propionivibrio dicarboxylicus]SDH63240.1 Glycosyltransferase involved in cell wall bisynthesis [Propionivibrio dicarboxylicus]
MKPNSDQYHIGEQGKRNIIFVATTPFAVNAFLRTHLIALARTYNVTLCVNTQVYPLEEEIAHAVRVQHIDIARKISPRHDLRALLQLWRYFRAHHPAAVHSMTPKAGLLAMLAAKLACVPRRFHTFTGQVWATRRGIARTLFKSIDWLIAACASQVFADSVSQCRFLESESVVPTGGVTVLGDGSVAGVDLDRFRPDPTARAALRAQMQISEHIPVFLFLGRMVRDKGVYDLLDAFARINAEHPDWALWMVGPDEDGLQAELEQRSKTLGLRVHWFGRTFEPERYMAAADAFVLPSYREGFGSVVIEAAACGRPAIAYRIDGVIDAIVDAQTGLLVEKGNIDALAAAIAKLGNDRDEMARLGTAAYTRALRDFSSTTVSAAWLAFYATELDRYT